jgi:hypothetical protein
MVPTSIVKIETIGDPVPPEMNAENAPSQKGCAAIFSESFNASVSRSPESLQMLDAWVVKSRDTL